MLLIALLLEAFCHVMNFLQISNEHFGLSVSTTYLSDTKYLLIDTVKNWACQILVAS